MKARIAIVSIVVVLLSFLAGNSHAVMHKVSFNAWTQTDPGPTGLPENKLIVWVEVVDDQMSHPPDFVNEIKVTAPDGSILYLDLSKHWDPWDKAFNRAFIDTDFLGGVIPGGNYSVTVTPNAGTALTETDNVLAKYLPLPVVTYPTQGQVNVPETPTFKWNTVTGATHYRIMLFNDSAKSPVYFFTFRQKFTDLKSYAIPPGDLKPNTNYSMRIEARAGMQDMDIRSRSLWISFTTGSW